MKTICLSVQINYQSKEMKILNTYLKFLPGSTDMKLLAHFCLAGKYKCNFLQPLLWMMMMMMIGVLRHLITFGGLLAHLAYQVHKSGYKTSIIIISDV